MFLNEYFFLFYGSTKPQAWKAWGLRDRCFYVDWVGYALRMQDVGLCSVEGNEAAKAASLI